MTACPNKLSAAFVKTIKVPGRYGDGRGGYGLSLLVKARAHGGVAKSWSQRLLVNGKPTSIGLGAYPIVTLVEVRTKALENRRAIAQGRDPRGSGIPTFEAAALRVIELHAKSWRSSKSAAQWESSLRAYVFPRLGHKLVSNIGVGEIMGVLTDNDFWNQKRETASRVKQRISKIMQWCVASGYCDHDPCSSLKAALPNNGKHKIHQRALPHEEVGPAIQTVRKSSACPTTKLAFEFLTLTASRNGEVRLARWEEINLEKAIWIIPPKRMKVAREHRVPLSSRAIEILKEASKLYGGSGLVFPSPTGRVLSDNTLSKLLRDLEINAVPHGFRSSFRDFCGDTGQPRELAEMALAHTIGGVEGAYARSDLFERRRELMEAWAGYIANSVTHG